MPTNILRKQSQKPSTASRIGGSQDGPEHSAKDGPRIAVLTAGRVSIRIELAPTPTADLVWNALPLYSTAETWGASINAELPLEAGRDRTARVLATIGDIYFWVENDRILVPFGPTPISRSGEIRLPSPCNVWARTLEDPKALAVVTPGEKVSLVAARTTGRI